MCIAQVPAQALHQAQAVCLLTTEIVFSKALSMQAAGRFHAS